jgi:hypothetical protein
MAVTDEILSRSQQPTESNTLVLRESEWICSLASTLVVKATNATSHWLKAKGI